MKAKNPILKHLFLAFVLVALPTQSVIASAYFAPVQTQFERFKQAITSRVKATGPEMAAMWNYSKKYVQQQPITQNEKQAAWQAFKNTGLPVGTVLGIVVSIVFAGLKSKIDREKTRKKKEEEEKRIKNEEQERQRLTEEQEMSELTAKAGDPLSELNRALNTQFQIIEKDKVLVLTLPQENVTLDTDHINALTHFITRTYSQDLKKNFSKIIINLNKAKDLLHNFLHNTLETITINTTQQTANITLNSVDKIETVHKWNDYLVALYQDIQKYKIDATELELARGRSIKLGSRAASKQVKRLELSKIQKAQMRNQKAQMRKMKQDFGKLKEDLDQILSQLNGFFDKRTFDVITAPNNEGIVKSLYKNMIITPRVLYPLMRLKNPEKQSQLKDLINAAIEYIKNTKFLTKYPIIELLTIKLPDYTFQQIFINLTQSPAQVTALYGDPTEEKFSQAPAQFGPWPPKKPIK